MMRWSSVKVPLAGKLHVMSDPYRWYCARTPNPHIPNVRTPNYALQCAGLTSPPMSNRHMSVDLMVFELGSPACP